ncbi:MAG: transcriptional repressor LexA [Proteobacteria bacterium]|nr:transcriptional repressor LexA [Pseudomonadota bacterium]MBU4277715.1 transcriptional repressor LexA [Pseudomonadota bacterium]MBU4385121.1 transcriptional repressor LexA [Pseudomonadota bacterium]MCG2764728.1 transcriptional repressor LexA [Desulfarculaceae bacterium]
MTRGLTQRQAQVLAFIEEFTSANGYPPTVREVAANFGFRSPRAAHDHMKALEKKGFMRSRAGRPRALEILHSRRGIPVLGRIAAGQPILAVEDAEEVLGLEPGFFGSGRFFALRVRGDSMVGDHIAEGDLVIIRAQEDARAGEVAAVLLGDEVTLKHFVPRPDGLELRAANPAVKSIMVGPEDEPPRVLGIMVGLVRKN